MKLSHWSLTGYVLGIGFSIFSGIRYFIVWPDEDKAIVYVIIGLMICALSWLYNKQLNLSNTLTSVEDYISEKKL